ncbi:MAG: insulinase family protein [Anaerolinea sp.]|nr:insulinase family protein [Anaerolinea sp.]
MTAPSPVTAAGILPFVALERTLANGLRVITLNTGFPNLVSLQIPVQTGSRNEVEPGKSGFAHFFEHMMFRGTERYPADAYQEIITRTGARQNAYTTDDYTNYHLTFAREDLETVLALEADRFMNLSYSEDDFKTEARAVLGEYNKNSADPLNKLIEVQRDNAFTAHTYKHTTMGFIQDIEDMPNQFAYSRTFFQRWYRPEYTTVIIAGDVEPEAAADLVEKYWGGWPAGNAGQLEIPREPPSEGPVVAHLPWPGDTLPWVTVGFHGPAFSESSPEYLALDVLLDLSFGETSDLYRRLVEDEQVVDEFFPHLPASEDPGLATVFARVKDPAKMTYVRDAIIEAAARVRDEPVDAARLSEAKSHARYAFARTLDNSESIASTLARYVRFRRSYATLNELYRTYDALTPADLQSAAQSTITDANMVVATLAAGPAPAELAAAPSLSAFSGPTPVPDAGLAVVDLRTAAPIATFKLLFEMGSAFDPPGKEGLAQLAASMITEAGSERQRIDEITRALFPLAASFTAQVDREMTAFTAVTHPDNLDRFEAIALPQLLEPGFRVDDFERLKAMQLNALIQDLRSNNEEELGKERLQETVFAGTAYGHPTLGTIAALESITLDDVRAFVAANYVRSRLTVGFAGAIPDAFADRLRRRLGSLPAGTPAPRIAAPGRRPSGLNVEILEKDSRSVAISFGHPLAVTRSHPDFAALWLARAWLGEHRASNGRLYQRIREARGMNYGDYAYIEAFPGAMYQFFPGTNRCRGAQLFEVWIRPVPPAQAAFALKAALFELRALIERGLSPEAFAATREYLEKNVYLMTKTQDQQLGYALDARWHGLGEFTGWMREELGRLTAERVNSAIREHLSGYNLFVTMIAKDAAGLRGELLSTKPATITYDGSKPPELLAEDQLIGALDLALDDSRVRVTPVEDVFAGRA